ncbi:MAG: hypothetical protein EXR98_17060 [Gemmataceae bacterium]|nr:hypothetical protein [Gemmataceae bacterium]
MSHHPSRRDFLQKTAADRAASLILPRSLFAQTPAPTFHFIHIDTLTSWPISDPVSWPLANAHEPILARAAEGLAKLTPNDADRILRLVVRRCRLNLIELHADQVVIHHWGTKRADLRPFFKVHRLARKNIEVTLRDRKKEAVTIQHGDDFLFGVPIASDFPLDLFRTKWANRFQNEPDDLEAAPNTRSGFAWNGVEDDRIPWIALKSAWRRSAPGVCLNCSGEPFWTNFGLRQTGMFNRSPCFEYICGECCRLFRDESVKDVRGWIVENLDEGVRPSDEIIWGRRVKWQ